MNSLSDMETRREHMDVPMTRDEPENQGAKVMAYILMILGIALIPVGIILTLIRESDSYGYSEFPYMAQGSIVVGVGVFLIFLAILLMLVVPGRRRAPPIPIAPMPVVPPSNVCASCGGMLMWIPAQQRWYCNACKEFR
jgi:uncharacterized membrane protein